MGEISVSLTPRPEMALYQWNWELTETVVVRCGVIVVVKTVTRLTVAKTTPTTLLFYCDSAATVLVPRPAFMR
jgi:hypothetical protein